MSELHFAAGVDAHVAKHAIAGDWEAAEQAELIAIRAYDVPKQSSRPIEPAGWGSCPMDIVDLEAAHEAARFGAPELATQIKDAIDERHARCLAGCAIRDVTGNCIAE